MAHLPVPQDRAEATRRLLVWASPTFGDHPAHKMAISSRVRSFASAVTRVIERFRHCATSMRSKGSRRLESAGRFGVGGVHVEFDESGVGDRRSPGAVVDPFPIAPFDRDLSERCGADIGVFIGAQYEARVLYDMRGEPASNQRKT